jgi:excisionase family DNA binding protein
MARSPDWAIRPSVGLHLVSPLHNGLHRGGPSVRRSGRIGRLGHSEQIGSLATKSHLTGNAACIVGSIRLFRLISFVSVDTESARLKLKRLVSGENQVMAGTINRLCVATPTSEDARRAKRSVHRFANLVGKPNKAGNLIKRSFSIRVSDEKKGQKKTETSEQIDMPASAIMLLQSILRYMAQGKSVMLVSVGAELTTQQAADILNVSRPYLVKLIKSEKIPYRLVGSHRRILHKDLLEYKKKAEAESMQALKELSELTEEMQDIILPGEDDAD